MNRSIWNKKVALSRWKNTRVKEKSEILGGPNAILLKSIICGFLAGDGCVLTRKTKWGYRYDISFFPDDKEMLETYLTALKSVYNKSPKIRRRDDVFDIRLSSRVVAEDIMNNAAFGIKNWRIPKKLLSNREAKINWIKAFFSAEGYVDDQAIKIQTVNKEGMEELSNLLNEFLIKHGFYVYQPKKKNYSKVYIIRISSKESRKKYYENIGFFHKLKSQTLKNSLNL